MPKGRKPYAPEFRRQMVELVGVGRSPEQLEQEFGPSAQAIRNWVRQAADEGSGPGRLTPSEREEFVRIQRELRQVKLERDILAKAAAWFARETDSIPRRSSDS